MGPSRAAAAERRPVYARVLGLRHLELSGLTCFALFEGAVTLGVLLALAELASWWTVIALPIAVAVMVKFNDSVAGSLRTAARMPVRAVAAVAAAVAGRPAVGRARVVPAQAYRAGGSVGVVRATASVSSVGSARVPGSRSSSGGPTGGPVYGGTTHGSSYPGGSYPGGSPPGTGSDPGQEPVRGGGARHRVGRQRGERERPREEFRGHAARHSASRRYR